MSADVDISALQAQIDAQIQNINSSQALEEFRLKYLGRKGLVAQLTGAISGLSPQQRGSFGQRVNALKEKLIVIIAEKQNALALSARESIGSQVDIGMPGIAQELGRLHPLTQVIEEVCAIFSQMGFSVVEGPEVETEYNNFTGLNIPLEHPSRDVFDTFYLKLGDRSLVLGHRSKKFTQDPRPNTQHLL